MTKIPNKPHKQICISMYLEDVDHTDKVINELKLEGFTRMNRSRLIRLALKQFDPSKLSPEDNHR